MNTPEETLDLMRDEFLRISALTYNIAHCGAALEIREMCRRAVMEITLRSPLIRQRDNAEREAKVWEQRYNEQTQVSVLLAQQRDSYAAKIAERKTVHRWLNDLGTPTLEATGKPMCLLRRLAVHLGIAPHVAEGLSANVPALAQSGGEKTKPKESNL